MAGLILMPTEGEAATYIETTDFGDSFNAATDLSSTFGNFLNESMITGTVLPGGTDGADFFRVSVAAGTAASIPFRAYSSSGGSFGFNVFDSTGTTIAFVDAGLPNSPGTASDVIISFMTPADGIIVFGTNYEAGASTINYSIGAVPEPTSALLAAAGIAASALVRRRNRA